MPHKHEEIKQSTFAVPGVKGFNRDMTCRGFQFKEGEVYTHAGRVKACDQGFHFCGNPLDAFAYYAPGESVYHQVLGSGEVDTSHQDDSKIACSEIHIGASISLHDIIGASIKFFFSRKYSETGSKHSEGSRSASSATGYRSASSATGYSSASSATGDRSASSATGYSSASSATGDSSASSATGYSSASSATGYRSASSATGDRSASSATGYRSASSATGDSSASSATGYSSASSATGDSSASSATGDRSASSATGYSSASSVQGDAGAAVATGLESKVMAGKYSALALAWWNEEEDRAEMRAAITGCGDGSDGLLKADTWYCLNEQGEFVEVQG